MKNIAAVMTDVKKIEIRDVEMPDIGDHEVMVKIEYVGICGSDIHWFMDGRIGNRVVTPPFILGHEACGVVCQTGKDVVTLKEGDVVVLEPGIPCLACDTCKCGKYNICSRLYFKGTPPRNGFLQRYISHPEIFTYKLPPSLTPQDGALTEPIAVGLHAAEIGGVTVGKTAAILGAGCIGLATLFASKAFGANKIVVTDLFDFHLQKATNLSADVTINATEKDSVQAILESTDGKGADIVFETAGNPLTALAATEAVAKGGIVVFVGHLPNDLTYNFNSLIQKEAQIKTVWRYCNNFKTALILMSNNLKTIRNFNVTEFNLENTADAIIDTTNNKDTIIKSMIRILD